MLQRSHHPPPAVTRLLVTLYHTSHVTLCCSALKRTSLQRDLGRSQGNQSWYANPQQQQQKQPFGKKHK
jgi:hypothetical protein